MINKNVSVKKHQSASLVPLTSCKQEVSSVKGSELASGEAQAKDNDK